jgi:DNA-binding transcriptional ArsR family regulator
VSDNDKLPRWADPARTVRLDATSVRGLAHPLRLKILGLLRTEGPATATTLATRLGLNTGATSYHLRQLAAYGFIVEDQRRGTGRERWWRAAHGTTYFDRETLSGDETGEAFRRSIGQIYVERIQRATDEYATLPQEWREASSMSDWVLRLTPEETRQLTSELFDVLTRYRLHDPESSEPVPPGAVPVSFQVQAIPHAHAIGEPGDGEPAAADAGPGREQAVDTEPGEPSR